jgi:hypothetical protein
MSLAVDQETDQGPSTLSGTVMETAGTKGVILVLYLVAVTAGAATAGMSVVEGVLPGALLVALLAVGILVEVSVLERSVDHVGVLMMGIGLAYAVTEYLGVAQGLWFPAGASGVLLASVVVDAVRHGTEDGFDVVDTLGSIDIVGLYTGILLAVYALLYSGDQLAFLQTPYFPAFALAFAVSILLTSTAYISRAAAKAEDPGKLHRRLVSVIGSLDDVEDDEEKREIAQHVRAVAGALNGVEIPCNVEDEEGRVPLVLPVSHKQIAFRSADLAGAMEELQRIEDGRLDGFLIDGDRNVGFVRSGDLVKFYLRRTERYGDDRENLASSDAFEADVRGYRADRALIDAVIEVTPEPSDAVALLEETEAEIERRLEGSGSAPPDGEGGAVPGGTESGGVADRADGSSAGGPRPTEEKYDIEDIEDVDGGEPESDTTADLDVGGRDIDLEEMLEQANEVFDEDSPY